jgi:predicted  nucleic acid-binding Zn-ribbon protein
MLFVALDSELRPMLLVRILSAAASADATSQPAEDRHTPQNRDSARCQWCYKVHSKPGRCIQTGCVECGINLCSFGATGRHCFELHKKYGLPADRIGTQAHGRSSEANRKKWDAIKEADARANRAVSPQGGSAIARNIHAYPRARASIGVAHQ